MKEKEEKSETFPRPGSAIYNMQTNDEEAKQKSLKKWRRANKFFTLPFYKIRLLPALGFGRIFLILTTIGRTTGKKRNTPLEYHWIDDVIHIFSGRGEESDWMKNIRADPDTVWVRHGFHHFHAKIEFVESVEDKKQIMSWYVTKHPKAAKMLFGWDPKKDDPETTDYSSMIKLISIVRLHRKEEE